MSKVKENEKLFYLDEYIITTDCKGKIIAVNKPDSVDKADKIINRYLKSTKKLIDDRIKEYVELNIDIANKFKSLMGKYPFPIEWKMDGIKPPSGQCTDKTLKICFFLYKIYGLMPHRIAPSSEEGWFIYYINANNNQRTLSIEVYNENMETVVLVNENKRIIYVNEIEDLDFKGVIEIYENGNI